MVVAIFYKEMDSKQISLEGDALQMVNLLEKTKTDWSLEGLLIKDARRILD